MDKKIIPAEDNIIRIIVRFMEQVECVIDKSGIEKKEFVLSGTKLLIGDAVYERYSYFILSFIDFAVHISKGEIKLNLNNIKKNYCCF